MEATMTTRKKYNVNKKITIKHYLREVKNTKNTIVRSEFSFVRTEFSLNILLTVDSKVTKFKSKIYYNGYYPQIGDDVEGIRLFKVHYDEAIKREKAVIEYIVRGLKPFESENFDIKKVNEIYNNPRWFLWNAINDYLYFELFETNLSIKVPMRAFVHPKSFLDYSENVRIKEIGGTFKSKIFNFDMILWALAQNDDYNFISYPPTIVDVMSGIFKKALMEEKFQALRPNGKDIFLLELEELLEKNINNFAS